MVASCHVLQAETLCIKFGEISCAEVNNPCSCLQLKCKYKWTHMVLEIGQSKDARLLQISFRTAAASYAPVTAAFSLIKYIARVNVRRLDIYSTLSVISPCVFPLNLLDRLPHRVDGFLTSAAHSARPSAPPSAPPLSDTMGKVGTQCCMHPASRDAALRAGGLPALCAAPLPLLRRCALAQHADATRMHSGAEQRGGTGRARGTTGTRICRVRNSAENGGSRSALRLLCAAMRCDAPCVLSVCVRALCLSLV